MPSKPIYPQWKGAKTFVVKVGKQRKIFFGKSRNEKKLSGNYKAVFKNCSKLLLVGFASNSMI